MTLLCGMVLTCLPISQAASRPNIVFIFSDDHAVQAIGAYGSKVNRTPHIDRLAHEGALYVNSFCANSICGPSRACILTGMPVRMQAREGPQMELAQKELTYRAPS